MIVTKKQTVTYEKDVIEKLVCDLCKRETTNNWADSRHNDVEVKISLRMGYSWAADAVGGDVTEVDLCPECFKELLLPWLAYQGALPPREYDYG